jgi:hypothetical protein
MWNERSVYMQRSDEEVIFSFADHHGVEPDYHARRQSNLTPLER